MDKMPTNINFSFKVQIIVTFFWKRINFIQQEMKKFHSYFEKILDQEKVNRDGQVCFTNLG